MIKDKDWKAACKRVPLEYHIELVQHAFEMNNAKVFEGLTKTA